MLKKNERVFAGVLFGRFAGGENGNKLLIGYNSLFSVVSQKLKVDESEFKSILKTLENEDYIEVIYTDRHGEPFLYITLKKRGACFKREQKENRRSLLFRLFLAVLSAIVTFVFGRLLYLLFS